MFHLLYVRNFCNGAYRNFCNGVYWQKFLTYSGFEFVFWLDRSILSTFKGFLKYFFQIKFPFWQEESRKVILILCFDRLTKWIYLLWQEKFSKFIWILVFTKKRQLGQRQNLKSYLKLKIHSWAKFKIVLVGKPKRKFYSFYAKNLSKHNFWE